MGTKNNPGKFDCYTKAEPDEPMFVLLGRDPTAGFVVAFWSALRLQLGLDAEGAEKIKEAQKCGIDLSAWARAHGKEKELEAAQAVCDALATS